jgi:hypothetical protein
MKRKNKNYSGNKARIDESRRIPMKNFRYDLLKKTFIFLILFLISFSIFSQNNKYETLKVCSGSQYELSIKNYFEGSVFEWYEYINGMYTPVDENEPSYNSFYETTVTEEKQYWGISKYNNEIIDTTFFSVIINPNPVATISFDKSCENEFTALDFSSLNNIVGQRWEINHEIILMKAPVYFNDKPGKVDINLTVVDEHSCFSEIDTFYHVESSPEIELSKSRLIDINYYEENINCGNDTTIYFIETPDNDELLQWLVTSGNDNSIIVNIISNEIISVNTEFIANIQAADNMLTIRWKDSFNEPVKITVVAILKTPDDCIIETTTENLIIPSNAPNPGKIFQKPNNSGLLFYKPIDSDEDPALNYLWGYTIGSEDYYEGSNRKYCDFGEFDNGKFYWVESYYSNSPECRTRNYLIPQSNKSNSTFQLSIYPNPADDFIEILGETPLKGIVSITNLNGAKLLQKEADNINAIRLNVSGYMPGKYLIVYEDQYGNTFSEKIAIQ